MTTAVDFSNVNDISREEIIGWTAISASYKKKALPTKIDYNNICFDRFITDMKYNPRPIFANAFEFAKPRIESVLDTSFTKVEVKRVGENAWQINHGFITVDICLHGSTEYIYSETVHEDLAEHRSAVSMIARFDINNMYRYNKYSIDTFKQVNKLYANLRDMLV